MNEAKRIVDALLDLGEAMLLSGLEIDRIERSLSKVGTTFQLSSVELLVLNAGLACTITLPDGNTATQTRRIKGTPGVNCLKAERLEHLVDSCLDNPLSADELAQGVAECCKQPDSIVGECVGSAIGVGGLTIAFGGNLQDALVAAAIALVIAVCRNKFRKFFPNAFVFSVIAAFVAGVLACGAVVILPDLHLDNVMSGIVIMLMNGLAFVLAMREMLMGNTSSGALGMINAIFRGLGLAFGIIVALGVTGVYTEINAELSLEGWGLVVKLASAYAVALGFGLMNHLPVRYITLAPLVGMIACGISVVMQQAGAGTFNSYFAAGAFAVTCANLLARYFNTSSVGLTVPAVMPMVPGSLLFYAMLSGVTGDTQLCLYFLQEMMVVTLSLSAGMSVIWVIQAMARKIRAAR